MSVERSARTSRAFVLIATLAAVALLVAPASAFGQTAQPSPTGSTAPALSLSNPDGAAGSSLTVNGSGFRAGETVDVTFNGASVGKPTVGTGGNFSLSFTVPNLSPGDYGILAVGQDSRVSASTNFAIEQGDVTLTFSVPQAAPGIALTITGAGFRPGEVVNVEFNGAELESKTADTTGNVSLTFTVPQLAPGEYVGEATGQTSGATASARFTVLAASGTPVPTAQATPQPTASPSPATTPAPAPVGNAPAMAHDERYFGQTGYRIENDQVWSFFQANGGLSAFGYPVSRTITFLGCPVQMFQRHIIQVCPSQGPALINLLDPEIFPYTQVNGSVFPAPDNAMKANTPPVSDPDYSTKISSFVQTNVPDTFSGAPVNFFQTFNNLGGLTIWGAPISAPMPDPSNANFIYQRFQRGIMHYIVGTGTESVLLADYLKAIITNQNVPNDLMQQSRESRFFDQYCPGAQNWVCRPADLPGTNLEFGFVQG